jgi:hypothetical protein
LELSRTTGIHVFEKFLLGEGVLSALFANDSATAEKLLEKMGSPSSNLRPWDACFYHHLRTHEALFREDLKEASLHTDLALKFCEDTGVIFSKVLCQLEKAHVLHALGVAPSSETQAIHKALLLQNRRHGDTEKG